MTEPVTLGDLRMPCQHKDGTHRPFYKAHMVAQGLPITDENVRMWFANGWQDGLAFCPGGRPATVADLVSALRAEGVLEREWRCLLGDAYGGPCESTWNEPTPWLYNARHSLCGWEYSVMEKDLSDALAEAQR